MINEIQKTKLIKQKALEIGFSDVGISKVEFLKTDSENLKTWLKNDMNADMSYMANHFDKRVNPAKLVENAKSVISVLYNYYPSKIQIENTYKISKYAYGQDYHHVVKDKLKTLLEFIKSELGNVNGRAFVDSAPVLDRAWATKSGLGWIGKNSNLINKKFGSFVFIGELILDIEFDYDKPIKNYCGNCTKCIDACPTNAIVEAYVINSNKCISYLTIEKKGEISRETEGRWENNIFGCDICQDVCPWNLKLDGNTEKLFTPKSELLNFTQAGWASLSKEKFNTLFKKSAIKRTKYNGLM
ncbi:MAG: tRNA epoxyqueuosine(34) reductase QueG, partial [Bacteroidales bacterium]|nr:tRNA epoxyqueuosine(34) reductase QueG [Bacteroidales bacterium]